MKVRGYWENVRDNYSKFERNGYQTDSDGLVYYSSDLFDATNTDINEIYDPGGNILLNNTRDENGNLWTQCQVHVPSTGFYKVRLKANINVDSVRNWRGGYSGMQFVGGDASDSRYNQANSFRRKRYEVKILRDRKTGDFGLTRGKVDKAYYRNNLGQNNIFDIDNTPKYFPIPALNESGKECETMLVDPAQNANYVVGLSWGRVSDRNETNNPLIENNEYTQYGTVLAAKSGLSWDVNSNPSTPPRVGIPCTGYMKWGRIGDFENYIDAPEINMPGKYRFNVSFDANGALKPLTVSGQKSTVLSRGVLSANSVYLLQIPVRVDGGFIGGWIGTVRLFNSENESVLTHRKIEPETIQLEDETVLEFYIQTDSDYRYLSLEIKFQHDYTVYYDITHTARFKALESNGDLLGWEKSNKYQMFIRNAPENYARRTSVWTGDGEVNAVIWLEAGELLTLVSASDEGYYKRNNSSGKHGWTKHALNFEFEVEPFRINEDWLKVNNAGTGTAIMDWNDPINFDTDSIDLVKFLPADVKTDDFIENFCKAFNLRLYQTDKDAFNLDVKQTKAAISPLYINLDTLATVKQRTNTPLGLPSLYRIGFTVNQDEEGYATTGEDGGGSFETGAVEESVVEQTSSFSYNWYKDLRYTADGGNVLLQIPVISKAEVWAETMAYPEAMAKRYTNLAARFWYYDGLLNDLGAGFKFNGIGLKLAKVSNTIAGLITLNYRNELNTILSAYFTILVNSSSHYTELEGYPTPEQYKKLDGSIMAMFNGDIYYVAEISGYDPLGRNKTKIKLIRKI